ncbi:hypothetical protein ACE38W_10400 [Chitinophaga sp. Hz27]|uniref:hypothetical protein n=1 Tax=Chitinophaga sp. Hz27 TaxID=3347169 RepID=UPI0035DD1A91
MKLFTYNQQEVINKIWIAVLAAICCMLAYLMHTNAAEEQSNIYAGMARTLGGIPMNLIVLTPIYVITFSLELFLLKNKHAPIAAIICSVIIAGLLWFQYNHNDYRNYKNEQLLNTGVTWIAWVSLMLLRTYLLDKKSKTELITAIIVGSLLTLLPWRNTIIFMLSDLYQTKYLLWVNYVYNFAVYPVIYYLIVYVADNISSGDFIKVLKSKITVLDKRNYLFFTVGYYALILAGSVTMSYVCGARGLYFKYYLNNPFLILGALLAIGILVVVPYLLKNIVVARALTINRPEKILLILHFIPIVNIIIISIFFFSEDVNSRQEDNANLYIDQPMSNIRYVIVSLGGLVLFCTYIIAYSRGVYYNGAVSIAYLSFRMLMLIVVLRVKWPLYILCGLSILSTFIVSYHSIGGLIIMQAILSFHFMMEIFHPALYNEDAAIYHRDTAVIGEDLLAGID